MKFGCACGSTIYDIANYVPYKGFLIRDAEWDAFWEAVDDVIEKPGASAKEREAACMNVRALLHPRLVFQCSNCGRLHVVNEGRICSFVREASDEAGSIFD